MMLWVEFHRLLYSVGFNEDSTILDLKNQLEANLGVPVGRQRLTFQRHSLRNESKVLDYQITDGTHLTLLPLSVNEVSLYHRAGSGRTPPITIRDNTTIKDLKETAEMLLNIPKKSIDLRYEGSSLEDGRLVRSYEQIRDRDDIGLVVKFKITVTGRGRTYRLLVHEQKRMRELKQMLQQKSGVPAATIRLRLPDSRNELEDPFPLVYYGITCEPCNIAMDVVPDE